MTNTTGQKIIFSTFEVKIKIHFIFKSMFSFTISENYLTFVKIKATNQRTIKCKNLKQYLRYISKFPRSNFLKKQKSVNVFTIFGICKPRHRETKALRKSLPLT